MTAHPAQDGPAALDELAEADLEAGVEQYAEAILGLARRGAIDPENWRPIYERGLLEAYRRNDLPGVLAMTRLMVNVRDAQGLPEHALAELDHALTLASNLPDVLLVLNGVRACVLAGRGEIRAGRRSIEAAEGTRGPASATFAVLQAKVNAATFGCLALDRDMTGPAGLALSEARTLSSDPPYLYLLSWFIPYLVAVGKRTAATPWIRSLGASASVTEHQWRRADAAVFDEAMAAVGDPSAASGLEVPPQNWAARWRLLLLELRRALWRADRAAAESCLQDLRDHHALMGESTLGDIEAFAACALAYFSPDERVQLERPAQVYLGNLGGVLSAAEAIALAGTQRQASDWLSWLRRALPSHVETSIEWPVSRRRVQALLALKAGRIPTARKGLSSAVEWAETNEYTVESGVSRIQLSELLIRQTGPSSSRERAEQRRLGRRQLSEFGIDPLPHAYVASRTFAAGSAATPGPKLTPREGEVLTQLAAGLTYRETATSLGVSWPTVQTLAHRAYEKLGVSGKVRATNVARELGII